MSTTTSIQISPAIEGKFSIVLAQAKYQQLADFISKIQFTEDNLPTMQETLKKVRVIEKAIEDAHKTGKASILEQGRQWDLAKNTHLQTLKDLTKTLNEEYAKICKNIEERRIAQEKEQARVSNIKNGIESNALAFANLVASATTSDELTKIERRINLEKVNPKYEEYVGEATERFNQLNKLLAEQKLQVRKLEELAAAEAEALKNNDDAKAIEIMEQKEAIETKVEEQKVGVQMTAMEQSINSNIVPTAEEIFPTVKARRTTWKYELVDVAETMKKAPEMLDISLNYDKAKEMIKSLKENKQLDGKTELIKDGIRYYEEKTF